MRKSLFSRFLPLMTILLSAIFSYAPVSATDSTLTMTTTDTTFNISPTSSGNFVSSTTPATISVTTDNYTGYRLTLESDSSTSPALVNVADSTKTIPSITSTISQSDFTSNSDYLNMWGIKPSKLNSADNSNYIPAPTTTAIVLDQTTAANSTANTYNLYPAAKVNYTVEAGSYTTTLIVKVVINSATYTITYADSSSSATNMPETQTGNTSNSTITLSANTPTYTGRTFMGWCDGAITNQDAASPSCSGTIYQPGATISVSQTSNNTVSLNAIWKYVPTMQTVATWGDSLLPNSGDSVQAMDTRDNKLYWVTRLADGNIWMTQNLDYVLSTTTTLTPSDSDVSSNWTPSVATQTTQYNGLGSSALWDSDYNTTPHSYRPASDTNAGTSGTYGSADTGYSPVIMINGTTMSSYKSEAECVAGGYSTENCAHWNVGTFYSWYAATAGTGNANVSTDGQNVSDSICPAGWHLPTGTSTGEFQALVTAGSITASTITSAPYYFLRSGYYLGEYGAVYRTGGNGVYWSSTSYSYSGSAHYLDFSSDRVYPYTTGLRLNGFSVRCVAI